MEIESTIIGFRATKKFKELMEHYIVKDTHSSLSDFIRTAIREKIQRDYPILITKLFEEGEASKTENPTRTRLKKTRRKTLRDYAILYPESKER